MRTLFEKYCVQNNSKLYVSFIDFQKAFDSIWHDGLFYKLLQMGIGGPFYKVLKSMYSKSTGSVRSEDYLSAPFPVKKGVRQGDILSPLLFNLFVNDIVDEFNQSDCAPPTLVEETVGCLLYADDLVIISTSAPGLQKSLGNLNKYCSKWKLSINEKKSKTMCMSKSGRNDKEEFQIGDTNLESVKSYSYLGIEIASSGSFRAAEKSMSDKATKALFKLKSLLYGSELKPDICLKLFDQLIKPIALYGSDIWGVDFARVNPNNRDKFIESLGKFTSEKLNLSFSRFLLGVHKKAQVSGVQGELGRYPLGIDIVANSLLYLKHLHNDSINPLLSEAARASRNIASGKGWVDKCLKLKSYVLPSDDVIITRRAIKQALTPEFKAYWQAKINSEAKMRTYKLFKCTFDMEDYLMNLPSKHRKALARFRISAHKLAIERGRYTRTPLENRTCAHCPDKVEDEIHFLTECTGYSEARANAFKEIKDICPGFSLLDNWSKFIYLMIAEGPTTKIVAKFISENLK